MDLDDIFGDIFERVKGCGWVLFLLFYTGLNGVCMRFNVRLCGKCSSASTTKFVTIAGFKCPQQAYT